MEIAGDKVASIEATGDRQARPSWVIKTDDGSFSDYEPLLKALLQNIANKGAFKVGGSLMFEFIPKYETGGGNLLSSDTSFFFHRMGDKGRREPANSDVEYSKNEDGESDYHKYVLLSDNYAKFVPMI